MWKVYCIVLKSKIVNVKGEFSGYNLIKSNTENV